VRFFGNRDGNQQSSLPQRSSRHSSGWSHLLRHLRDNESLRVLDIGSTSSGNINFLTNIGHSIYMASIVEDMRDARWKTTDPATGEATFDADRFLLESLDFGDRRFDVVLLWDTLDYIPEDLVGPVLRRLREVVHPGGVMLAFFHIKPEEYFSRYHLREDEQVDMQPVGNVPIVRIYNNRQIENLFTDFSAYKFFLAKDNLREIVVTC